MKQNYSLALSINQRLTSVELKYYILKDLQIKSELKVILELFFSIPDLPNVIFEYLHFENQRFKYEDEYIRLGEKLVREKFYDAIKQRENHLEIARLERSNLNSFLMTQQSNSILEKKYEESILQNTTYAEKVGGNKSLLKFTWKKLLIINDKVLIHELNCMEAYLLKKLNYNQTFTDTLDT